MTIETDNDRKVQGPALPADVQARVDAVLRMAARRRREKKIDEEEEKRPMRIFDVENYRIERL